VAIDWTVNTEVDVFHPRPLPEYSKPETPKSLNGYRVAE
jgi:hypothetical protein